MNTQSLPTDGPSTFQKTDVKPLEANLALAGHSHFIDVKGASMAFPRFASDTMSFRRALLRPFIGGGKRVGGKSKTVLQDISFRAKPGDRIGLIGANGAGKTTLLHLLMGIYEPQQGMVRRVGTTTSLINNTLGMDPYLSGYENIHLRCRHLRIDKDRLKDIIPEIEKFTELGDALNDPIRTYSSGMMARLAFGTATIARAQIYLMDEWIGAGDARFFERCEERLAAMIADDSILILASHSDSLIEQWCNRVIVMDKGRIAMDTTPEIGLMLKRRLMFG